MCSCLSCLCAQTPEFMNSILMCHIQKCEMCPLGLLFPSVHLPNRHVSLVQEAQAGLAKIDINTHRNRNSNRNINMIRNTAVHPMRDVGGGRGPSGDDPMSMSMFPDPGPSPSPPPRPTPAPAQVSLQSRREAVLGSGSRGGYSGSAAEPEAKRGGTAGASGGAVDVAGGDEDEQNKDAVEVEMEMGRLVEWRDELLATGMYTPQNPIVSELNRRIALSTGRRDARPLQREE